MRTEHIILAIETSCDETAAAVFTTADGLRSHIFFSQTALHQSYGGVVPEIASRSHIEKIRPVIDSALTEAKIRLQDVTAVAITNRPGLPGSLLTGLCFGKSLAYAINARIIGIDHLEGHAFSSFLEHTPPFPHLCLTASGGHTALYRIDDYGIWSVLGRTQDDAAGEAFDKTAKLLDLPYPGGPVLEKLAASVGFVDFYRYPRTKNLGYDFSFSGLKTAILYDLIERGGYDSATKRCTLPADSPIKAEIASSLHCAVADIFEQRIERALVEQPDLKAVTFVGGVACNQYLKNRLRAFVEKRGRSLYSPSPLFCTDNAAMIAFVGHYKAQQNKFDDFTLDIGR